MTLQPGDLMFVGWDGDNEDVALVATTEIAGGEVIYFTDDEWDGDSFNTNEQLIEWTVPDEGIPAGTVITLDLIRNNQPGGPDANIDAGGVIDYIRGGGGIAANNEAVWAFQGTRDGDTVTPENFIGVIANEDTGNDNQTPNLSGTGLTETTGAIIFGDDQDYLEFTQDDPVVYADREELIAAISDLDNWDTGEGTPNDNPNGIGFDLSFNNFICFTPGAMIRVPGGERPVEDIVPGDLVVTLDRGAQPVRWVGKRRLSARDLAANPHLAPVRVTRDALAPGLPSADLVVSPQHRMMLAGLRTELLFGNKEVLASAKSLINGTSVTPSDAPDGVEYIHLLFDRHEVIFANGAATESLYPGDQAMDSLGQAARREVLEIFPELAAMTRKPWRPARRLLRGFEGRAARRALPTPKPSKSATQETTMTKSHTQQIAQRPDATCYRIHARTLPQHGNGQAKDGTTLVRLTGVQTGPFADAETLLRLAQG